MSGFDTQTTLEEQLSAWIRGRFQLAFPECDAGEFANCRAVPSANPAFGDYQCNDAMPMAKKLRANPRAIAQKVVDAAPVGGLVAKLELAGPGFLNITLSDDAIAKFAEAMAASDKFGVPQIGVGKTVVVDYSSPNVAKPMHIGHIRSTVIGSAIDRLHRAVGYNVIADNHIGDWGTQFGIIIMGYRNFLDEKRLAESPVEELERVYVQSYGKAKDDPEWMDKCRAELVKLQAGDPENTKLWRRFIKLSLGEFDRIYGRLDVKFDTVRGESFYNDALAGVVQMLQDKGLAKESDGAIVVNMEDQGMGVCIVRKSDGGFNYATTDVATVMRRVADYRPEKIVYVTDERQQLHFRQFFKICRDVGVVDDSVKLQHVWFGLMRLPEGTFSTRQGNVIKLEALLNEAEARALKIINESRPDMPEEDARKLAADIGIGAIKYADLSQSPQTLITFSWEKALALDGNSGPYLQYAYARICSVRDKYAEQFPGKNPDAYPLKLELPAERGIALKVAQFPAAVVAAAQSYKPSILADYLYGLSQEYSSFYQQVPFLKADEGARESRVRLCGMVARALRDGLGLLGIRTPTRI